MFPLKVILLVGVILVEDGRGEDAVSLRFEVECFALKFTGFLLAKDKLRSHALQSTLCSLPSRQHDHLWRK